MPPAMQRNVIVALARLQRTNCGSLRLSQGNNNKNYPPHPAERSRCDALNSWPRAKVNDRSPIPFSPGRARHETHVVSTSCPTELDDGKSTRRSGSTSIRRCSTRGPITCTTTSWTSSEFAAEVGFDAVCVNEHHSNGYGLMPSPNLIASLARRTTDTALCVMGQLAGAVQSADPGGQEFAMMTVSRAGG